jgi:hypothetical protein
MYLFVFYRICMYLFVFYRICIVFSSISKFLQVFDSLFRQMGLMPPDTKSYPNYPLTCGQPSPATLRIESFHQAVGLIRCFDARRTDPARRIKCDWYDRDNEFLKGAKKLPQYTDLIWNLFFLVMKHYSPLRNLVLKV